MLPDDRHASDAQHRPARPRPRRCSRVILPLALLGVTGCDFLTDLFSPPPESAHAQYIEGLVDAGLAAAPAAQGWIDAGAAALTAAETEPLPIRTDGWFDTDSASAVAVRFAPPGRRWVTVRAHLAGAAETRLFIDAFRMPADTSRAPEPVATSGDTTRLLWFRARGDEDLVVRIQPELLRGGAWELEVIASDDEPDAAAPAMGGSR